MHMDTYSDRRNRARRVNRRREEDGGDIIVTAITIQVIVCLVLVLVFAICKKVDRDKYDSFKSEYTAMINDSSRNSESIAALRGIADSVTEAFEAFEAYLSGLLGGGSENPQQTENTIIQESGNAASLPSSEDAMQGGYDYKNAFFTAASLNAGGWNPIEIIGQGETLSAPDGSTFSPVMLTGYLKPPVSGLISSPFGYRYHPVTQATDFHTGMDIAAAEGTSILAALPGEVKEVGESAIYGKYLIIQHATNLQTFYAHCSDIIAEEGMAVRQGERIAKVGSTGMTTGPHLHFSVIVEEQFTDPYWLLKDDIRLLEEE